MGFAGDDHAGLVAKPVARSLALMLAGIVTKLRKSCVRLQASAYSARRNGIVARRQLWLMQR
jgi:hypothetical protein